MLTRKKSARKLRFGSSTLNPSGSYLVEEPTLAPTSNPFDEAHRELPPDMKEDPSIYGFATITGGGIISGSPNQSRQESSSSGDTTTSRTSSSESIDELDEATMRLSYQSFMFPVVVDGVSASQANLVPNQNLAHIVDNRRFHDVIFVVGAEEEEVYAYMGILACRSDTFAQLFEDAFCESKGRMPCRVRVPSIEPRVFRIMLRFLYTNKAEIGWRDIIPLFVAAQKYKLPKLEDKCLEEIKVLLDNFNALEVLEKSVDLGADNIRAACLEYIRPNAAEIIESEAITGVSEATMLVLMQDQELQADEIAIFDALMKWITIQGKLNQSKELILKGKENEAEENEADEEEGEVPSLSPLSAEINAYETGGITSTSTSTSSSTSANRPADHKCKDKAVEEETHPVIRRPSVGSRGSRESDSREILSLQERYYDLLKHIRLPLISVEDLFYLVEPTGLFSEERLKEAYRFHSAPNLIDNIPSALRRGKIDKATGFYASAVSTTIKVPSSVLRSLSSAKEVEHAVKPQRVALEGSQGFEFEWSIRLKEKDNDLAVCLFVSLYHRKRRERERRKGKWRIQPSKDSVSVTLVNHRNPSRSVSMVLRTQQSFSDENGWMKILCTMEDLLNEQEGFLLNGRIYLQVKIPTTVKLIEILPEPNGKREKGMPKH